MSAPETPTPRTDAAKWDVRYAANCDVVNAKFAAELERELTAAQAEVAKWREAFESAERNYLHWQEQAADLNLRAEKSERERDDWQKLANERSAELIRAMGERDEAIHARQDCFAERKQWREGFHIASKERDEAQKSLDDALSTLSYLKSITGEAGGTFGDREQTVANVRGLIRERDDARADVDRLCKALQFAKCNVTSYGAMKAIDAALAREREAK